MHKRIKVSLLAAALLAGAGASHYLGPAPSGSGQGQLETERESLAGIEFAYARQPSAFEYCQRAAQMIFDVHWAAACMAQVGKASPTLADGHAECELPDDKAAVVNAWLRDAEKRCTREAAVSAKP